VLLPGNLYYAEVISLNDIVKIRKRIAAKHPYAESPETKSRKLGNALQRGERERRYKKKRAADYAEKIAHGVLFVWRRYISSHNFSPLVISNFTPEAYNTLKIFLQELIFMENTENLKNTVASISDAELRARVEQVMLALGIPPTAMGQRFSDMSAIRKVIMNMSESDFHNIMSTVGEDRAQTILRGMGKK
jgi:hypothetical protein